MSLAPRHDPTLLSVAGVIARREAMAAMRGVAGYVALSVAILAAAWMLLVELRALEGAGIIVREDVFRVPLAAAMLVLSLFLAVWAAVSAARDRENGTLEVLFYAPVDELSYLLGKITGLVAAYAIAMPVLFLALSLLAVVTGFALTPDILPRLVLSIIPAAEVVGFGLLLSVGTDGVRSALLLLIGAAALLLGVTIGYRMVLLIPVEDPSSPVLPLRDALAALNSGVSWLSPFASFERILESVATGAWRTALIGVVVAVLYTGFMVALAALWLRRRGVFRRGE